MFFLLYNDSHIRIAVGFSQPFVLMLVHLFPLRTHKSVRIQAKVVWYYAHQCFLVTSGSLASGVCKVWGRQFCDETITTVGGCAGLC